MKPLFIALSITFLASPAFSADNYCAANNEATCPQVSGCAWKPGETWTRESDGKTRVRPAGCKFSSKAARSALATLTTK